MEPLRGGAGTLKNAPHSLGVIIMPLTAEQLELAQKLLSILFPYHTEQRDRVMGEGGRFVHYTSAENALKIINSKSMWMRNAACMADYREVQHGFGELFKYFQAHRTAFDAALNDCFPGSATEAFTLFDQWWPSTQRHTYITSISEHDKREDLHGRLSMWRAFGGASARVALVLKLELDVGKNSGFGAIVSPVAYFTDADVALQLNRVVQNVQANRDFLRSIDRTIFIHGIFLMLATAAVCIKHEGFREEREWRVIYSPRRTPANHIMPSIEVVGGVPQIIYKIPLKNDSAADISGLEPNELLDRVIIGPTQFTWAMYDAFVAALEAAGV
jgi:hypothetical protein